ncbi:MarR family transcriptional regulator [Sulfolobus sp. E5-1-F]|uniref:HTH-type transcriptional regulator Lrs14 n=1 Tax=Sulfolobaceae TaxID=118883 RepID=UPI00129766CD|nr:MULTISPECIES: HTH-type transcriptional regulator Lrs14 [unclassified Sulfolobus]QGA54230.1 MarR family transcriptional regulator [Sulfolobus sp. E5-1-F]QGA69287.1 MarR family transcriptional regulator [Sulfolobus sp. E11-6]
MQVENIRVRLPSGKEVGLIDALNFCYDISDTDFQVLKTLLTSGPKTEDELAEMLHLSKASINRSVNKLVSLGFVDRVKDSSSKGGRPRYIYKPIEADRITEKISSDFKYCADLFSSVIPQELKGK